ncbi:hypothetical protein MMC24_000092 [Lignoscripta atroalba]|nr:hypothetical protein [Lignoscripta atroalba]
MSAPAPGEDKPQGLSKFMRRASKVLKRGNSNKDSISGVAEPAPAAGSPSSPQSPLEVPKPDPIPSLSVPAAIQQPISDIRNPADKEMKAHTTAAASEGTREERARALFAKHGFTLEPGEWTPSSRGRGERVEKKIRFRVHRHCHRCQTTFGSERLCNNCQHTRCKKCPRFPPKQPSEQQAKALGTGVAPIRPQEAAKAQAKSRTKSLTMPSKTTGIRRRNALVASIRDARNVLVNHPKSTNIPTVILVTRTRLFLSPNGNFE